MWYEDPKFDFDTKLVDRHLLRGDECRRALALQERGLTKILRVTGVSFRQEEIAMAMKDPRCASLEAEPNNPHDPLAIRVHVNGLHVGYVPRAQRLHPHADVGVCKIQAEPPCVWLMVNENCLL